LSPEWRVRIASQVQLVSPVEVPHPSKLVEMLSIVASVKSAFAVAGRWPPFQPAS
jgi:hypothetical protein